MALVNVFTHVPVGCSHVDFSISNNKQDERNLHLQGKRSSQRQQTRK